jgi:Recombination endonuclease VII
MIMELITAREAFDKGFTRYFTGKPCKNGHIVERMISNGSCVDCLNEKTIERRKRDRQDIYEATKVWRLKNPDARKIEAEKYRKKHPDKVKANQDAYRARNPELVRQRNKDAKARMRATNPEREKERLKRYYARKEREKWEEAGRPRPDVCDICDTNDRRIVFDHCHTKGNFRGWLCDLCNLTLGYTKDNVDILKKMIKYLESNGG